jgi:hypothetical protein
MVSVRVRLREQGLHACARVWCPLPYHSPESGRDLLISCFLFSPSSCLCFTVWCVSDVSVMATVHDTDGVVSPLVRLITVNTGQILDWYIVVFLIHGMVNTNVIWCITLGIRKVIEYCICWEYNAHFCIYRYKLPQNGPLVQIFFPLTAYRIDHVPVYE